MVIRPYTLNIVGYKLKSKIMITKPQKIDIKKARAAKLLNQKIS